MMEVYDAKGTDALMGDYTRRVAAHDIAYHVDQIIRLAPTLTRESADALVAFLEAPSCRGERRGLIASVISLVRSHHPDLPARVVQGARHADQKE